MRNLKLWPREKAVARCILSGYSNERMAKELGICRDVVKTYVFNLYNKTGQDDRIGLVTFLLYNPWELAQVMEVDYHVGAALVA